MLNGPVTVCRLPRVRARFVVADKDGSTARDETRILRKMLRSSLLFAIVLSACGGAATVGTAATAPSKFERDGWSTNYRKGWDAWMRRDRAEAFERFDALMQATWGTHNGQPRPLVGTLQPGVPSYSVFVDQTSKFIVVTEFGTPGFLLNGAAAPIRLLPNANSVRFFWRGNAEHLLVLEHPKELPFTT